MTLHIHCDRLRGRTSSIILDVSPSNEMMALQSVGHFGRPKTLDWMKANVRTTIQALCDGNMGDYRDKLQNSLSFEEVT